MRSIIAACLLAVAPLSLTSACATFETVTPASPRNALAQATVTFIGVADVATALYQRGVLSPGQVAVIVVELNRVDALLTTTERLLLAGEDVLAATNIADAAASLARLSTELYALGKANPPQPAPAYTAAPPQV